MCPSGGDMSSTKKDLLLISLKIDLFSPWYSWTIAELALNNNHSLTLTEVYEPREHCLPFWKVCGDIPRIISHFIWQKWRKAEFLAWKLKLAPPTFCPLIHPGNKLESATTILFRTLSIPILSNTSSKYEHWHKLYIITI